MTAFDDLMMHWQINTIVRAFFLVILGFLIARIISASLNKALRRRLTPQQSMLLRRIIFYLIFILFLASAIQQLGFHITALLGATGILTVALGIASQTSMSNIISGIFIIGEKPFEIGDTIKVTDIQGEVIAIDFLSVKIRTSENILVRIPNETLLKSAITNISFFPIRRVDILIGVAYASDLDQVQNILLTLAKKNSICLPDPKPLFLILNFGDTAINIQFSVWGSKENYNALKNAMHNDIKNAFAKAAIDMPRPSHSIYIESINPLLPIKIIAQDKPL